MQRRTFIESTLFGTGYAGLRALATGLPASWFLRPLPALADESQAAEGVDPGKAQYLILSTSSAGDPVNANVPGSYAFPDIAHAPDPSMAPTPIQLGTGSHLGAQIWSTLPPWVLERTCFFHHATLTNNHPNLPKVMRLMGATAKQEMFPSLFAKSLAPAWKTVQAEPISVGAGAILTYEGRGLPNLPPTGLRDVLTKPDGALLRLQELRDRHLDRMYALIKRDGTKAQAAYLDRLALSRAQARSLSDDLLDSLSAITSDRGEGPIQAAATLIRMNVAPVLAVRIDMGGDNHTDEGLAREVTQHGTGVGLISKLMETLKGFGLEDRVTFAMMNVFGRTLKKLGTAGRDHWASHNAAVLIGKAFRPGVIGGLEPKSGDYGATGIASATGRGDGATDIPFDDTLGALGKTLGAALGLPRSTVDAQIGQGKVVDGALA